MTPEQAEFLRAHGQAILATGRRDGSPQVSTIIYSFDGEFVTISVTTDRAKWVNATRQPHIAMVVNEGRRQLVLYGTAEGVGADHPERIALWRRHRELQDQLPDDLWGSTRPGPPPEDDAEYHRQLDDTKRVLLRIRPDRVFMNQ
jgi:PPOX class probable F420-dependent enzyme